MWTAVTLAVGGLVGWLVAPVATVVDAGPGGPAFYDLLTGLAALVLAGCLGWLWLVCTASLIATGLGADLSSAGAWAGPAVLRRAVLAACGLALVGAAAPAIATPGDAPAGDSGDADHRLVGLAVVGTPARAVGLRALAGLPLPERAVAPAAAGRRAARPSPAPTPSSREVVVRPGDTLWGLAAAALPPGTPPRLVDEGWRALYRANLGAVGLDPDLISPGTHLRLPTVTDPEEPS